MVDKKTQLATVQTKLGRLLNAMLEGVVSRDEHTAAKESLIGEKSALQADLAAMETQGSVWLEPFTEFIKQANQAEKQLFRLDWKTCANFTGKSARTCI